MFSKEFLAELKSCNVIKRLLAWYKLLFCRSSLHVIGGIVVWQIGYGCFQVVFYQAVDFVHTALSIIIKG